MTNFSIFLEGINKFTNESIKNRDVLVIGFFKAAGARDVSTFVSEGNTNFRKICAGSRNLSGALTDFFPKNPKTNKEIEFLKSVLNSARIKEMFVEFGIDEDEKENFDIFCESISMQFENFMKYGDEANTTVKSIYEVLIDKTGYAANPNANEEAIMAAYEMFSNSLKCLCRVDPRSNQFSSMKEPIESYLQNISQVYGTLFARLNRLGRITYKSLREKYIKKDSRSEKFIKMASEPGALPIKLMRKVFLVAYNFPRYDDFCVSVELNLNEDFTKEDVMCGLDTIEELKDYIEVFFTEYMHYHLRGEEESVVNDVYIIARLTKEFLERLSKELGIKMCQVFLDSIRDEYIASQRLRIAFSFDGSYYRPTKKVEYAVTLEQIFFDSDGNGYFIGDKKKPYDSKHFPHYGDTFEEVFDKFTEYSKKVYRNLEDQTMNEILVINADNTYRSYVFYTTCKAKAYRIIRDICYNMSVDNGVAFYALSIVVKHDYNDEIMALPAQERIHGPGGVDLLEIFGATWDRIQEKSFLCSELLKGNDAVPDLEITNFIYRPLICTLIGVKATGHTYTSVFKQKERLKPKKPASK